MFPMTGLGAAVGSSASTPSWLGGIGSFLGKAGGFLGSLFGFGSSSRGAKRQMEFQAQQAALNRQFQERMSNTAVQRRMDDMRQSGINPILAAKWDASTPAGAMAQGTNPGLAGMQGASLGGATAIALKKMRAELNILEAQEDQIRSQTSVNMSQVPLNKVRTQMLGHGEVVASMAANAVRVGYELLGTKDPKEIAEYIRQAKDRIVKFWSTEGQQDRNSSYDVRSMRDQLMRDLDRVFSPLLSPLDDRASKKRYDAYTSSHKGKGYTMSYEEWLKWNKGVNSEQ